MQGPPFCSALQGVFAAVLRGHQKNFLSIPRLQGFLRLQNEENGRKSRLIYQSDDASLTREAQYVECGKVCVNKSAARAFKFSFQHLSVEGEAPSSI